MKMNDLKVKEHKKLLEVTLERVDLTDTNINM